GNFTNHSAFQTMVSMRNGNLGARLLNTNMVMWITNDDIYVSVRFTVWGEHGVAVNGVVGAVSYIRSTPPPPPPPTVSITTPASGAVFAAPANVTLQANATVTSGTVTNVEYFRGTTSLGRSGTTPFTVTANGLGTGAYALTAVATAAGVSSTSAVVNISVVSAVPVVLSSPAIGGGQFSFDYAASPGLRYVIERATAINMTGVLDWTKLMTNTALSNPSHFSDSFTANGSRFYRVGQLPNP